MIEISTLDAGAFLLGYGFAMTLIGSIIGFYLAGDDFKGKR